MNNDLTKLTLPQLRQKAERLRINWERAPFIKDEDGVSMDWETRRRNIEKLEEKVAEEIMRRYDDAMKGEPVETAPVEQPQAVNALAMLRSRFEGCDGDFSKGFYLHPKDAKEIHDAFVELIEQSRRQLSFLAELNGSSWIKGDGPGEIDMRQRAKALQTGGYNALARVGGDA